MADEPAYEEDLEIRPCRHYRRWVHALAEDTLTGPARWYIRWHIGYCNQCRAAWKALRNLRLRLRRLADAGSLPVQPALSPERRLSLESALNEIETKYR
jgi:hypothetical protein